MEETLSNEVTTFAADAVYLSWTRPSRAEGTELGDAVLRKRMKFAENTKRRDRKGRRELPPALPDCEAATAAATAQI